MYCFSSLSDVSDNRNVYAQTQLYVMFSLLHFANDKSNSASFVFLLNSFNAGLRVPSARVLSTFCGGLMPELCTLTVSCTLNSGRYFFDDKAANSRLCLCRSHLDNTYH